MTAELQRSGLNRPIEVAPLGLWECASSNSQGDALGKLNSGPLGRSGQQLLFVQWKGWYSLQASIKMVLSRAAESSS